MLELGQTMGYAGAAEQSTPVALRILEEVRAEPAQARWIETVLLLNAQIDLAARGLSGEVLRQAEHTVDRLGASAPLHLLAVAALERAWAGGTAREVAALAQRALADGRLTEGLIAETPWAFIATTALTITGEGEVAERALAAAMVAAREGGSARGFGVASAQRALSRYRCGVLDGAAADARAFLDLADESAWHLLQPITLATLVDVLIEREALSDCAAALARWDVRPHAPQSSPAQPLRESRARLHMARGEHARH